MPDSLSICVGEIRQLRQPPGGVGRWTSNAPAIVSTTDEDFVTNKPGGLITAIKVGQARITADGYDGKTGVLDLDVRVETKSEATAVRVAKNEVADLPSVVGVTRWTIANPQVAELAMDGRVRGISPGITTARGQDNSTAECFVEVTGSLDVTVGQSVRLADFFDVPVRSWHTSCPSEVEVDTAGMVKTGVRARTVEVSAELVTGRTFAFNLRIRGGAPSPSRAVTTPTATNGMAPPLVEVPFTVISDILPTPQPDQRRIVDAFLAEAEAQIAQGDWVEAGAKLMAARVAAATDSDLSRRAEQIGERFRAGINQRVGILVQGAIGLIASGQYAEARGRLDAVRAPRDWAPLAESLRHLATLCAQLALDGNQQIRDEVDQQLEMVWNCSAHLGLVEALPVLAEMGLQFGERIVQLLLDMLCSPTTAHFSLATRQALEKKLGEAGALALESVIVRLADDRVSTMSTSVLLNLLPDLGLQKNSRCVVKFYRQGKPEVQARLVERMAALHSNTPGALFDLLAGVLNGMPPDPGFAKAIQAKIRADSLTGRDELETKALVWAGRGNRNAQVVLHRLYGYDAKAMIH